MTITKDLRPSHPKYRPDIDGLRAIAVLSVLGFHALPEWIHGGFIGVDIFFVISGYLISTIIFENLALNSFSFKDFYYRRTSRIFPALLTVLTACFLFGWFFFTPIEFSQLGKHISSGAGFISNFTLWRESGGYFEGGSSKKILLHLWSLGIEEQFYLLWPILAWVFWRLRLNLFAVILASLIASFTLNITSIVRDPVSVFYHPGTRVWELLIGSALAYINFHQSRFFVRAQQEYSNLLSGSGIFLVLLALTLLNKDSQFPGWWALLPTLGAAFVISAKPSSFINTYLLGNKCLVWFGLISFPLYLWHWPLLSITQTIYTSETPPILFRVALVIFSIGLAWATYKFIEIPLRRIENSYKKFGALVMLMAICGAFSYSAFKLDGIPSRFHIAPLKVRLGENICRPADVDGYPCEFGNPSSTKTILIYGDSVSGHLTNALNEALGSQYRFIYFGHTSCFLKKYDDSNHCEILRSELYKYRDKNVFAVIRSHSLSRYGAHNAGEIKDYLLSAVTDAERFHPQKVIISGDVERIDTDCEFANYYIGSRRKPCGFDMRSSELNETFLKVSRDLDLPRNVFFIYPHQKLCKDGGCQVIKDATSNYYNGTHLSTDGALLLMPDIVQILGN
ncbi:acyltransferase family protein [Polynucleobacter sp. Fuers-14]|uniref:acyltransferase family protein n=1 Tax=Polynucleobacter sp. Fuers-14 TaxID=1758364 RepID=UPI001C0AD3EF|nr:acyltransferase family protein [Polynucleobacter sp. Fuers-14]MBU3641015.1 acyltransferase [Polynucleobacter sp. Fuers-14]